MVGDRFLLVSDRNQCGRGSRIAHSGQIVVFQNQRTLQHHLHLRATGNIDVSVAREERNNAYGGQPRAEPGKTALNGVA